MYFQAFFVFDRIKALAPQHPEWTTEEPFASILRGDVKSALAGGEHAIATMLAATHAGMTFKTFIVSGGGIEFMRPWTEKVYGIPPEQVIGSSA